VKIQLCTLVAAAALLPVAACGSHTKGGPSDVNPGAAAGQIATTPATSQVTLTETGATELYPLLNQWAPAFHQKYPNVTITTADTGSGAGISQAAAEAVNIGASGAYLSEGDFAKHPGLMNIALTVDSTQVNYNLPGLTEHLKLNGKVLAAMYKGTIKTWNDPQISGLNPGVNLPDTPVVPLHRSDGSGATFLFAQYLS
jgi:phosphate transport system substrate-binding protein